MRFWQAAWLVVLAFGVGGFTFVSILVAVKGFAEVKAILRRLRGESDAPRAPEP